MTGKIFLTIGFAGMLCACSSSPSGSSAPPAEKPAPKPTESETGRVALQRLYTTSRGWAPDTQPISIQSQNYKNAGGNPDAPLGHDGKSAVWRGLFGSRSRQSMKTYMWSGLTGPDAPNPGINPGSEDSFSANNTSTTPFDLVYLKIDSDKALETAQKHGGAALLKKDPDMPVNFGLNWEPRRQMLTWHVNYGKNSNEPDIGVVVNATTGDFVRVEK
ncbi:MAG TPA: PepSY domain-containing protein [Terriglobales bacterium]|nr:PepSY domain-containing protein [Terriglobales bacterium]